MKITIDPVEAASCSIPIINNAISKDKDIAAIKMNIQQELTDKIKQIQEGKLDDIKAILFSQAVTLDALFQKQVRFANLTTSTHAMEIYSRLAIKTQNACRATLATLVDIIKPNKTIFVRQQNNVLNQQINDCSKNELLEKNPMNKMLEVSNGKRLDSGEEIAPIEIDSYLEALDTDKRA